MAHTKILSILNDDVILQSFINTKNNIVISIDDGDDIRFQCIELEKEDVLELIKELKSLLKKL